MWAQVKGCLLGGQDQMGLVKKLSMENQAKARYYHMEHKAHLWENQSYQAETDLLGSLQGNKTHFPQVSHNITERI